MNTKTPKELLHEESQERGRKRQGIAELISQVRTLKQSVGRAQYEAGSFPKDLRWELEEALSKVEQRLWSEWKTPTVNSPESINNAIEGAAS